jgi:hypothetical protein
MADKNQKSPGKGHWQKPKAQSIDKALCARTSYAFDQLKLTFDGIAHDAGLPSKSQLVEISNAVLEPSKRILRYLARKGFSAHWLLTGKGAVYALDDRRGAATRGAIIQRIRGDVEDLQATAERLMEKSTELSKVLNLLLKAQK